MPFQSNSNTLIATLRICFCRLLCMYGVTRYLSLYLPTVSSLTSFQSHLFFPGWCDCEGWSCLRDLFTHIAPLSGTRLKAKLGNVRVNWLHLLKVTHFTLLSLIKEQISRLLRLFKIPNMALPPLSKGLASRFCFQTHGSWSRE